MFVRSICCLIVGNKSRLVSGVQGGPRGYYSRRLVVDFSATCDKASVAERTLSGTLSRGNTNLRSKR